MPKEKSISGVLLDRLSSVKLTLVLFFALAAASVLGTLLPQGIGLADLKQHFSPAAASLINFLSLNNLYHSAWFMTLLLLLFINLVACMIDRLPKTIRLLRTSESVFDSQKLSRFGLSSSIAAAFHWSRPNPSWKAPCAKPSAGCAGWSRKVFFVL